jgi:FAD-linked sulfhydryl oxidase
MKGNPYVVQEDNMEHCQHILQHIYQTTLPARDNPGMYDQIYHNLHTPLPKRIKFFRLTNLAKISNYKRMSLPESMKQPPPPQEEKFPPIGMGPSVWGPIFWTTMHIVSLGYSNFPAEEEKIAAINFFESLQYMIPCPICKEHYKINLDKMPVKDAVHSKQALIRWMFNMHNEVNKQLNKPEFAWKDFIHAMGRLSQMGEFSFSQAAAADGRSLLDTQSLLYLAAGIGIGAVAFAAYKHYVK